MMEEAVEHIGGGIYREYLGAQTISDMLFALELSRPEEIQPQWVHITAKKESLKFIKFDIEYVYYQVTN